MIDSLPKSIERRIEACLQKDRHKLFIRVKNLNNSLKNGIDIGSKLEELEKSIQVSTRCYHERQASVPDIVYPQLPITEKRQHISKLIRENQVVVLCGETGSGKTTQLPKICMSIGRGISGMIGHTQPRRIAARSVAQRIADELSCPLGGVVGYQVRFQDYSQPGTLVKVMTDGILLAEIQTDRYLNQYDTLILDEAHERSLNIDFLLGYLKWLLPKRADLKLIVTSATIDPQRFSSHFSNAPIIEVSGRVFPVEIRYQPTNSDDDGMTETELHTGIIHAVEELSHCTGGDILVFLSGERDIREAADNLRKHFNGKWEIVPLFSRLSAKDQEKVFLPHQGRRIVLATNVAETSLTVPGIHAVIDTGMARISRYSFRNKIQRLPVEKISQASANQRSGRCGRIGPGICIRLYSEEDYLARAEFTDPEIFRTNLAAVILQMKSLRLGSIDRFPFLQAPDHRAIRDGVKLLHELNALDGEQKLTSTGRQLTRIQLDPRLARIVIAAEHENCLSEIAIIVAALSIQDPRERPLAFAQASDEKHKQYQAPDSDFLSFLNLWLDIEQKRSELSNSKFRKYCRDGFLSHVRIREWREIHSQLLKVIKKDLNFIPNKVSADYVQIHKALLSGLISNIGFKQDGVEYLGARNLKFYIHPGSVLFRTKPKWVMAAEQVETSQVYARCVAKVNPEWIENKAAHLVKLNHFEPHWEKRSARPAVFERSALYGITLQSRRKIPLERINKANAREIFIRSALVEQDYDCNATFFNHNQDLLDSLGYLQHKGRRVDLIADDSVLYEFFDSRVPASVVDGNSFNRWRRKTERDHPDLLKLCKDDVFHHSAWTIDVDSYPDSLLIEKISIDMEYHFEPGHENDGVTALIPIHQLNQLKSELFEKLVPGLLREKIIYLLKCLPKSVRRNFVPVQEYTDLFLQQESLAKNSLYKELSAWLCSLKPVDISANYWKSQPIPAHLCMNFRILDDQGQVLGEGRELSDLQKTLLAAAKIEFQSTVAKEYRKTGCKNWQFGEIQDFVSGESGGHQSIAYPGLMDEGDSVGYSLFESSAIAEAHHKFGITRLIALQLKKELKFIKRNFKPKRSVILAYSQLNHHRYQKSLLSGYVGDYYEDFMFLLVSTVFIVDKEKIRSDIEMERRIQMEKSKLMETESKLYQLLESTMDNWIKATHTLKTMTLSNEIRSDISEQLELLIYKGFLVETPYIALSAYPRYIKAILHRLDKAKLDQRRDQNQLDQLLPLWRRYWVWVQENEEVYSSGQDDYRWQLEELRVSLFAQMLKTAYPVSRKRLDKIWSQRV